jgi:hypothetical protein
VLAPSLREFLSADGRFTVAAGAADSAAAQFCVRPERMRILGPDEPALDGLNLVHGTLQNAANLGSEIHHAVLLASGRTIICVEQNRDQSLPAAGAALRIVFRPADCILVA